MKRMTNECNFYDFENIQKEILRLSTHVQKFETLNWYTF